MDRFLVKFKCTRSLSSFEVGLLYRIAVMSGQGFKGKAFVQGAFKHIDRT